jgi:hypothetical protein
MSRRWAAVQHLWSVRSVYLRRERERLRARGMVCRLGNLPSITGEGLSTFGGRAVVSAVFRVI